VAALALAATLAGAGPAAAQTAGGAAWTGTSAAVTWSAQPTPRFREPDGNLNGISCTSPSFCMSVGWAGLAGAETAMWNGTSWQPEPFPSGQDDILDAVSCTSPAFCVAVGGSTAHETLIATWDGTGWTVQSPSTQGFVLAGVSCSSPSACLAVGGTEESVNAPALAERWNGQKWSTLTQPGAPFIGDLNAVSCSSSSACTATGYQIGWAPLIERWNGTHLTLQQAAAPPGNGPLTGVSCPDSDDCVAVGDVGISPPFTSPPYIEAWDGTAWSVMTSPAVAGGLAGVSCTAATACTAVGSTLGSTRGTQGSVLTERLSGGAWAVQTGAKPAGSLNSGLNAVSCPGTSQCLAVGSYDGRGRNLQALAEGWDGTGWTLRTVPGATIAVTPSFLGVSCSGAAACTAVGSFSTTDYSRVALGESWDGGTWVASKPQPAGQSTVPVAVSCPAASMCLAVGSHVPGDNLDAPGYPWAAAWNGSRWSTVSPPRSAGSGSEGGLGGVSCVSATSCIAVGSTPATQPLAYAWNGTGWTRMTLPAGGGYLGTVSCTSATWCVAVGATGYGGGVTWVADAWDGTTWTPMPTAGDLGISAVSCSSPVACTAVGSLGYDPDQTPVIERWDGTAWTAQTPAPPPAGDKQSALAGVSCASATACTAVGSYRAAGPRGHKHNTSQAFIQAWNGATWTAEQAPAFGTSGLASVSCTAPAACTAVGFRKVQRRWGPLAVRSG
jgi:hypothetical protein